MRLQFCHRVVDSVCGEIDKLVDLFSSACHGCVQVGHAGLTFMESVSFCEVQFTDWVSFTVGLSHS